MDVDKKLLVKVNFDGAWKKNEDNVWRYDAMKSKYIRLQWNTTYASLLEAVYEETEISREEKRIEVHAWDCYPNKQEMPPFELSKDSDVATFIELNSRRDVMIPLCITSTVIESLKRPRELLETPQCNSQSVNQEQFQFKKEDFEISLGNVPGIDDIKEGYEKQTSSSSSDDGIFPDLFDDEEDDMNEEADDDGYDHFEKVFDPYFRVFVNPDKSPPVVKNNSPEKSPEKPLPSDFTSKGGGHCTGT